MMYYVYTNRFQPLSILHEKEIEWLAANIGISDKIIIGIVNPVPADQQEASSGDLHDTWIRGDIKYNPLSYWQRYLIVKNYVEKNQDVREKVIAIIPHARPSTNMKEARKYLPEDFIECLSTPQQNNEEYAKRKGIESQHVKVCEIPSHKFGAEYTLITPDLICCLIAIGSNEWGQFVSGDTKAYLESIHIEDMVKSNFKESSAKKNLKRIYNRESDQKEQRILFRILRKHMKDITFPELLIDEEQEEMPSMENKGLVERIYALAEIINSKLGSMAVLAPNLYPTMVETHNDLYTLADAVKEKRISKEDGEKRYDELLRKWNSRKG